MQQYSAMILKGNITIRPVGAIIGRRFPGLFFSFKDILMPFNSSD